MSETMDDACMRRTKRMAKFTIILGNRSLHETFSFLSFLEKIWLQITQVCQSHRDKKGLQPINHHNACMHSGLRLHSNRLGDDMMQITVKEVKTSGGQWLEVTFKDVKKTYKARIPNYEVVKK